MACSVWLRDHIVEGGIGIVAQVGIGVALHHRQAVGDAGVHAGLAELHAARIHALAIHEMGQQRTVAAADIERTRAGLHHVGDELQVDADRRGHHDTLPRPRTVAAPFRKPESVRNISGSS